MLACELFEDVQLEDGQTSEFPIDFVQPDKSIKCYHVEDGGPAESAILEGCYVHVPFSKFEARAETFPLAMSKLGMEIEKACLELLYLCGETQGILRCKRTQIKSQATSAIHDRCSTFGPTSLIYYKSNVIAIRRNHSLVRVIRDAPHCERVGDEWVAQQECGLAVLDHRCIVILEEVDEQG